jgi:hypothetical protein
MWQHAGEAGFLFAVGRTGHPGYRPVGLVEVANSGAHVI